jgi:O-antigen ligase
MLRRMRRRTQAAGTSRAIVVAVAGALVALALAGGGYGVQARAIASIVVWWLVAAGALAGMLPLASVARAGRWLIALLAALALLTAASLAWASDGGAAFQGVALALLYLGVATLVLMTLTRATAAAWLRGLAVGLTAVAALALASRVWPGSFHDTVAAQLPAARDRLSYPLGYWNALGLAMASAVLLLLWIARHGATWVGRGAALALVPLPALALYLTSSRGAVAALVAGLVVLVALEPWRIPRRLALGGGALALAAAVALGLAAHPLARWHAFKAPPTPPPAGGASVVASHLLSSGGSGRYQFWTVAWHAFERHPIAGIGAGGYEAWWTQHASLSYSVRNAHSFPLETLAELGLAGGAVLLALTALAVATALRRRRAGSAPETLAVAAALAACGAVSASVDWMWQVPAALAPALVAAVILTGLPASGAVRRGRAARGAACGIALAAIAVAAIALLADVELARSRAAVRGGRLAAAATDAANAAAIEPWAADPRLQLALVEERRGELPAARRALAQALARAPRDWRLWLVAARLRAKAGDAAGAQAALDRVRCLNPRSPFRQIGGLDSRRSTPRQEVECVQRRSDQRSRGSGAHPA